MNEKDETQGYTLYADGQPIDGTLPEIKLAFSATEGALKLAQARLQEAARSITCRLICTWGMCEDIILGALNNNPKWWHYYKHAKKARTRKKYKRRLKQQARKKLESVGLKEAIT